MRDTVARLCAESSDRIPKWLLPVVRQQLETRRRDRRSAAVVASWARYAEGVDEQGEPIDVVDRLKDSLSGSRARQREDPDAFIANRELFGDLADDERFAARLSLARCARCTSAARARRSNPSCRERTTTCGEDGSPWLRSSSTTSSSATPTASRPSST